MKHNQSATKGPSQRQLRVAELIRHAMTELLARGEVPDDALTRAFITIPEVRLSPDLKLATIFVTLHDKREEKAVMRALEASRRHLRTEIAHRVNLKFAPDIRFRMDDGLDKAARIDALLRSPEVLRDTAPQDRGEDESDD